MGYMQPLSQKIPWSGGLMAAFSSKWSYELVSLPSCSWEDSSKASKAPCGLDSSQPVPQVPWPDQGYCPFSRGDQLCPPASGLKHCWITQHFSGVLKQPFLLMGQKPNWQQVRLCLFSHLGGTGRPTSDNSQIFPE